MKTITTYVLMGMLLLSGAMSAQSYKTTVVTTSYKNLENSTLLTDNKPWKNPWSRIAIPFSFHYFNRSMDSLYVGAYGIFFTLNQKDVVVVGPYDATDRGQVVSESPISYAVTGEAGSRILKIEWRNTGFYKDNTHQDYYNVQVWIYEGSENMEVHVGPTSIKNVQNCQSEKNSCSFIFLSNFEGTEEVALERPQDSVKIEKIPCKSNEMHSIPTNGMTYCVTRTK